MGMKGGKYAAERCSMDPAGKNPAAVRFVAHFHRRIRRLGLSRKRMAVAYGERHERSVKTCRGALNGTIAGIIAREAFVAACLEASMPSFSFPGRESRARIRLGQHALLSSRASVTTSPHRRRGPA